MMRGKGRGFASFVLVSFLSTLAQGAYALPLLPGASGDGGITWSFVNTDEECKTKPATAIFSFEGDFLCIR